MGSEVVDQEKHHFCRRDTIKTEDNVDKHYVYWNCILLFDETRALWTLRRFFGERREWRASQRNTLQVYLEPGIQSKWKESWISFKVCGVNWRSSLRDSLFHKNTFFSMFKCFLSNIHSNIIKQGYLAWTPREHPGSTQGSKGQPYD